MLSAMPLPHAPLDPARRSFRRSTPFRLGHITDIFKLNSAHAILPLVQPISRMRCNIRNPSSITPQPTLFTCLTYPTGQIATPLPHHAQSRALGLGGACQSKSRISILLRGAGVPIQESILPSYMHGADCDTGAYNSARNARPNSGVPIQGLVWGFGPWGPRTGWKTGWIQFSGVLSGSGALCGGSFELAGLRGTTFHVRRVPRVGRRIVRVHYLNPAVYQDIPSRGRRSKRYHQHVGRAKLTEHEAR